VSRSPVAVVAREAAAAAVLHPLRLKILDSLREPDSAAGVARRLNLPRQRVNYHLRELARAGFLERAGQRRRGNMIERRYVATARSYVLSPELLGRLGLRAPEMHDALSAAHLLGLVSRAHGDVARALQKAEESGKRLATFSMTGDLRFETAEQRAWFAGELQRAVLDVVDRFASPATDGAGVPAAGRLHRLVVAVYPVIDDIVQESKP
jgi:DNA-binding transcriptional ArsR family regulator